MLLHEQCKLQAGTPLALYREPKSLAAANLMSDPRVNVLPRASCDNDEGCLAIRPEHVLLPSEADQTGAAAKVFDMQVDSVERSGDETFVHGRVSSNGNTTNEQYWVVRRPGMHSVSVGEMLALRLRGADILNLALD